ncbi:transmembrane reductase CYB561D2-like [Euwallacea fornicatus]|uniref:transmembrane reductase CYB561D2-like n=1 Tax=Euwallacea fornicatus TaxID=995702 RepID=UPI00338ED2A8
MSIESASATTISSMTTSSTTHVTPKPKTTTRINVTTLQRLRWILNTFYYQLMATLTLVMFWCFFDNSATTQPIFTTHLVLSTIAYIPLMAVSIILFSEDNVTTLYIPRTNRNWIHGVLLIISAVLVTIGIAVEISEKSKVNRRHFTSKHAIYGLSSWVLIFVSLLLGVIVANTRTFSMFVRPILAKFIHNLLGLAAFALGLASIYVELGFFKMYHMSDHLLVGVKTLFILLSVWSGLTALYSLAHQFLSLFR